MLGPADRVVSDEVLDAWLKLPRFACGNTGDAVALTTALKELCATKASLVR